DNVTVTGADVVRLPAPSRATAVRVWAPLAAAVVSLAVALPILVSSAPRLAPSSWNCTPTTPTLSEALALTVIVLPTVLPDVGAVIATAGAVVPFETVTVTAVEVATFPAASRARAVNV